MDADTSGGCSGLLAAELKVPSRRCLCAMSIDTHMDRHGRKKWRVPSRGVIGFLPCIVRLLLPFHRKIMRVDMAIKAAREFFQQTGVVRSAVACCAIWNESMAGMAFTAIDAAMLAGGFRPGGKSAVMAGSAGWIPAIASVKGDLFRFVHRVA